MPMIGCFKQLNNKSQNAAFHLSVPVSLLDGASVQSVESSLCQGSSRTRGQQIILMKFETKHEGQTYGTASVKSQVNRDISQYWKKI